MHMIRKTISIRNAFDFGLDFIKNNIKISIIIIAILNIFYLSVSVSIRDYNFVYYNIIRVIVIIGTYLYAVELIQIAHCWYDYHSLSISDLKLSKNVLLRHLTGFLIFVFFLFLTTLLLIIPGIYYFLTYYFFQYFIIDKNSSIKEAFRSSYEITKGMKWKLLSFHLLILAPPFISYLLITKLLDSHYLIILFIPSAIWSILAGLATFHIYRQLCSFLEREETSK